MPRKWSAEKFAALRRKKFPERGGLSQAARLLGVTPANLQRWEKGQRVPGVEEAAAMAELVGVRVDDLLE